jgi:hypothetical protein
MGVSALVQAIDQRLDANPGLHRGPQGSLCARLGHGLKVIRGQDQEIHIAFGCRFAPGHAAKDNQLGNFVLYPIAQKETAKVLKRR